MSESWLDQKRCPSCGNGFAVLYPHLWRYKRGTKYFCSWKCLRMFDKEGGEDEMYTKTKADGTPARKPGPKKKKPEVKLTIDSEELTKTDIEQVEKPDEQVKTPAVQVKVETAQGVAWNRINELAWAIRNVKDEKLVSKWANEITWQCTIIDAMRDYD